VGERRWTALHTSVSMAWTIAMIQKFQGSVVILVTDIDKLGVKHWKVYLTHACLTISMTRDNVYVLIIGESNKKNGYGSALIVILL
jgi:hypothetical protein